METGKKLSRREFTKVTAIGAMTLMSGSRNDTHAAADGAIRLGGPAMEKYESPEEWVAIHQRLGYSAAYCPVDAKQSDDIVKAYAEAAKTANIIIAEAGAWSNPIDIDSDKALQALDHNRKQLALADRIGARCCVNISGARGEKWDGHHPDNLSQETFDLIVETVRKIIDDVNPTRTYYTLETMPWAYPDSPDSYLKLIQAIDRKQFAAHLDPVNIVNSPRRYYSTGALIRECFEKLGPYIKSCHAKDILLQQQLTVHLDEIRPGLGGLDYGAFLMELTKLDGVPLMLEHLGTQEEYTQAAEHIRAVGKKHGLQFG